MIDEERIAVESARQAIEGGYKTPRREIAKEKLEYMGAKVTRLLWIVILGLLIATGFNIYFRYDADAKVVYEADLVFRACGVRGVTYKVDFDPLSPRKVVFLCRE